MSEDLIPQPHGGALRPWTSTAGAAANRSSMRAIRKQAIGLLAEATPKASGKLVQMLDSEDERVVAVAADQILNRVLGKPTETPQVALDQRAVDISHLSALDRARLSEAFGVIQELLGIGPGRLVDDGN